MDDASLSEQEQRILAEIERNLVADDPDFVRQVRTVGPRRDALRLLRLSIFGLVVGCALLLAFTVHLALGILGFGVMLAAAVGVGTSVRSLAGGGRQSASAFRSALRRAESRLRARRKQR